MTIIMLISENTSPHSCSYCVWCGKKTVTLYTISICSSSPPPKHKGLKCFPFMQTNPILVTAVLTMTGNNPSLPPPPHLLPMSHIFTCPVSVPATRKWPDTPSAMGRPSGSLHASNCFTVPCQRNVIGRFTESWLLLANMPDTTCSIGAYSLVPRPLPWGEGPEGEGLLPA